MTWEERTLPSGASRAADLDNLFADQRARWELLRDGMRGLERARSRVLDVGGYPLLAWHIPHRIGSSTARVDEGSIRERPCFLCVENLPAPERAFRWSRDFLVTCNPFPILAGHVSVVCRDHRPQRIGAAGEFGFAVMLDLAADLPGYLVLYNGPECGASAPDHMHFQACRRDGVPLLNHLDAAVGGVVPGFPSNPVVLAGRNRRRLEAQFRALIRRLAPVVPGTVEPMVNVVVVRDPDHWWVLVFPRTQHRPAVYHTGGLTWSPGALDLTGTLVLPVASDLERATGEIFERAFAEVCLPADEVRRLAAEMEGR